MSAGVLSVHSTALDFLGRHTSLSRRVGYSEKNSEAFSESVEEDRQNIQAGRFRGVDPYSPFYTKPLGKFRGLDDSQPMFRTPSGNDHRYDRNGGILPDNHPLKNLKPNVDVNNPAENRVNRIAWHNPVDLVTVRPDGNVHKLLTDVDDLNNAFMQHDSAEVCTQEKEISEYARRAIVPGVDDSTWSRQPDVARLALENRAGLADRLRSSDRLRSLLDDSPEMVLRQESRRRVSDELDGRLKNTGDILDDDFRAAHPLAALNLLDRSDLLRWVEEDRDNARQYKRDAGRVDGEVRQRLATEAAKMVQARPFDEDYFQGNETLAEAVWAGEVTDNTDSFATWLNGQEGILRKDASAKGLAAKYWTEIAKRETGGEGNVPSGLFDSNPSLSMMAALDSKLAESLENDSGTLKSSYPAECSGSLPVKAYRAYGLGLADRKYGNFQRIL